MHFFVIYLILGNFVEELLYCDIMKRLLLLVILLLSVGCAMAQTSKVLESIPVNAVRLTQSSFKHAEQMDVSYLMALDPDRLLAPYRKEAGLQPKAENYPNWENTGLDGHIGGHYISALSFMYASTGNEEIRVRLEYMLSELELCQKNSGDGYLCGAPNGRRIWNEISQGNIRAGRFDLNGGWVPLYNIHKIYAGLRDAYLQAGYDSAKRMLAALTEWMYQTVKNLDEEQMQRMLYSEHGGLSEVFADAAVITGQNRYLDLAKRFCDNEILEPLLRGEDRLTGMHANTQIPKVIGYKRIADIEGNDKWDAAARLFWERVVENRSITIGGNSVREHFHPADDFSSMLTSEQGPETCNTYNMLRLTKMLYETSGLVKYVDFYEQALYNHILSSQHPEQGGLVYFTPMRSGHYRVYSQPQTSFWCCVGSGIENHARYGEMIYAHSGDELSVNLFIPSQVKWKYGEVEQITRFPEEESTTIIIHPTKGRKEFSLRLRVPSWCAEGEVRLSLNGQPQEVRAEGGYIALRRQWRDGDKVEMLLPMSLRAVPLPDGSPNYSFMYGPIVLASSLGTQQQDGIFADAKRMGHVAQGPMLPLEDMPCVVGEVESLLNHIKKGEQPLTFTMSGVYPARYERMTLQPFYKIHGQRYMVYWPLRSEQEIQQYVADLARQERERMALMAITTDVVVCGEQQPESDHFIQEESSSTGGENNRHWREARGGFSYQLSTGDSRARTLRVVYHAARNREAIVTIDGVEVGRLAAADGNAEVVAELPLPDGLQHKALVRVKIGSANGGITPRVYEVRLVTE